MSSFENVPANDLQTREARAEIVTLDAAQIGTMRTAVSEALQSASEQPTSIDEIGHAIGTLAGFFIDNDPTRTVKDDGKQWNTLLFQQRGAIGNLCQNAHWMLANCDKRHEDLMTKLDQEEATCDGSEIALGKLARTVADVEAVQMSQLPACRQWLEICTAAYMELFDEAWKPFVSKGASTRDQGAAAVKARIAALRGKVA